MNAFTDLVYIQVPDNAHDPNLRVVGPAHEGKGLALGPFPASSKLGEVLRLVQRRFGVSVRPEHEDHGPDHGCAACRLARACVQDASALAPARATPDVEGALAFLSGRDRAPLEELRERMERASDRTRFEEAATLRNRIEAIQEIVSGRSVPEGCPQDADVFAMARDSSRHAVQIAHVRERRLRSTHMVWLDETSVADAEVLSNVLSLYYADGHFVPDVVLLSDPVDAAGALATALGGDNGSRTRVRAPRRGPEAELVRSVTRMGERALEAAPRSETLDVGVALERLRVRLGLYRAPMRIDYFDVSHISGSCLIATRVSMVEGRADPSRYARRRLTTPGLDGPSALYEAVSDSVRQQLESRDLPDWILVEGGKQALAAATAALRDYGASQMQIASIARQHDDDGAPEQQTATASRIFQRGREDAVVLPGGTPELRLLERLCEEAHRYAVERGATLLRRERTLGSLHDIPGVGETRRKRLIRHFGSVDRLHVATIDELARVPGIGRSMAVRIHEALHGSGEEAAEPRPALGA